MKWWKIIKQEKEHPVDPAIAEEEEMEKTLYGKQKKLDKDNDGDIDEKDLRELREEK